MKNVDEVSALSVPAYPQSFAVCFFLIKVKLSVDSVSKPLTATIRQNMILPQQPIRCFVALTETIEHKCQKLLSNTQKADRCVSKITYKNG